MATVYIYIYIYISSGSPQDDESGCKESASFGNHFTHLVVIGYCSMASGLPAPGPPNEDKETSQFRVR